MQGTNFLQLYQPECKLISSICILKIYSFLFVCAVCCTESFDFPVASIHCHQVAVAIAVGWPCASPTLAQDNTIASLGAQNTSRPLSKEQFRTSNSSPPHVNSETCGGMGEQKFNLSADKHLLSTEEANPENPICLQATFAAPAEKSSEQMGAQRPSKNMSNLPFPFELGAPSYAISRSIPG